jgi:hypothetical protein
MWVHAVNMRVHAVYIVIVEYFFYYFLFKNNKKSYIYVGMKIYICSMKWFYACIKKFTFQKIDMMEVIIPL